MRSGLRILFLTLITATAGLCQQVNPNKNIRWSAAQGCASMNLVFAPANGACIQAGGVAYGFNNNVGSAQGTTDTTLVLDTFPAGYPIQGVVVVDSEYENYTGISGNTLTGITRGYSQTTPATHIGGAIVLSVDLSLTPPGQIPTGGLFGAGAGAQYLSVNCGSVAAPLGGGFLGMLVVNCSPYRFYIDAIGGIHQEQIGGGSTYNYMSPIYIGGAYEETPNSQYLPVPIRSSTDVVQTDGPNQLYSPIGITAIAGPVISESAPTLAAPILTANFIGSGSCSATYEVTGIDADGGIVPGTAATITGLASTWTSPAGVNIQAPMAAGIVTYNAYRTAVSGCGSLNTGLIGTATSGQFFLFSDFYTAGDGTTAPVTNTSVAKACVSGEAFCELAGTSGTPPLACNSGRSGWIYHITAAVTAPFYLTCISNTWTNTAGSGSSTATIVASSETVTSSATPSFSTGFNASYMALTTNVTSFTLASGLDGQHKTLCFKQGGSFTISPPANVHGFMSTITASGDYGCQSYIFNAANSIWLADSPGVINQ